MAINYLPLRNIYPTAGGETIADMATGPTGIARSMPSEVERAAATGGQMSPLVGLAVFLGLSLAIMLIAQHVGEEQEFRNIRASAYNVLLISLIAVAGIPVWKVLFTRVQVPGVSQYVLSV